MKNKRKGYIPLRLRSPEFLHQGIEMHIPFNRKCSSSESNVSEVRPLIFPVH